MAITQTALVFLGALATLTTAGIFFDYSDEETPIILTFAASIMWILFGFSSFDVIAHRGSLAYHYSLDVLVWLGLGIGILLFLLLIKELYAYLFATSQDADIQQIGR